MTVSVPRAGQPLWRLLGWTGAAYGAGALLTWTLMDAQTSSVVFFAPAGVTSAGLVDPVVVRDHLLAALVPQLPHTDDVAVVCLHLA